MDHDALVAALGLEPHPEGGHFRRTYLEAGGAASSIVYLLAAGERSRWHRVDAVEIWNHAGGGPLDLSVADRVSEAVETFRLATPPSGRVQAVVPAGAWQRAEAPGDHALVTCVVVPAFRWEGFEVAPAGWEPGGR